jgi:hypothetical protein
MAASAPETAQTQLRKEHPMIELRPFAKLGGADHGWLKAKHHFSFGSHYDPDNMGHGALRVWNDDEIAPNTGFPAHPHANMKSSPMFAKARSRIRTRSATRAVPRPATCR